MKKHLITGVERDSIANELNIKNGDHLISVNNKNIIDIFDYVFETTNESIQIEILSNNKKTIFEIEKETDEDIGIKFESDLMDQPRTCTNKCVFCFVDQLPDGMRKTLYFKDDDVRLSFLHGNYVTLTNTDDQELDRIIRYRFSPINISVHSTDPDLRKKITGNRHSGKILSQIKKLIESKIEVNLQFVIVPGLNDKAVLADSLDDLLNAGRINSISLVPVGLTHHRSCIDQIQSVDKEAAMSIISITDSYRKKFFNRYNRHTVYAADELYAKLGYPVPNNDYYEEYPQLENGVGMARLFIDEFNNCLSDYTDKDVKSSFSIITAQSFYPYMKELISELDGNDKISVHNIKNKSFGELVTVSGLLNFSDVVSGLDNEKSNETIILPNNMFRQDDMITLDGYGIKDFGIALGKEIKVAATARELLCLIFSKRRESI